MGRAAVIFCLGMATFTNVVAGEVRQDGARLEILQLKEDVDLIIGVLHEAGGSEIDCRGFEQLLLHYCEAEDSEVRTAARSAYIRVGGSKEMMWRFLRDENPKVKYAAAEAMIERYGDVDAVAAALAELKTADEDPLVFLEDRLLPQLANQLQIAVTESCLHSHRTPQWTEILPTTDTIDDELTARLERFLSEGGKLQIDLLENLILLGGTARPLCPVVEPLLHSKDWNVSITAAAALAAMHPRPGVYVDRLIIALKVSKQTIAEVRVSNEMAKDDVDYRDIDPNEFSKISDRAEELLLLLGPRARCATHRLGRLLRDSRVPARTEKVLRILKHLGKPAVVELTELLNDSLDIHTLESITTILGQLGPAADTAVPALVQVLENPNLEVEVRVAIIAALENMGVSSPSVEEHLRDALNSPSAEVRIAAAQSLHRIGASNRETMITLIERLGDTEAKVRLYSALFLIHHSVDLDSASSELIELFDSVDDDFPELLISELPSLGPAAAAMVPRLIELLKRRTVEIMDIESIVDDELMNCFASIGESAVAPLIDLLESDEPTLRFAAVVALGRIGPAAEASGTHLRSFLRHRIDAPKKAFEGDDDEEDEDENGDDLRESAVEQLPGMAAWALGRIAPKEKIVVAELIQFLKSEIDSPNKYSSLNVTRIATALACSADHADGAVDLLLQLLDRNDILPSVRSEILWALVQIQPESPQTIDRIRHLFRLTDEEGITGTAEEFGDVIAFLEAHPALHRALQKDLESWCYGRNLANESMRRTAALLLMQIAADNVHVQAYLQQIEWRDEWNERRRTYHQGRPLLMGGAIF